MNNIKRNTLRAVFALIALLSANTLLAAGSDLNVSVDRGWGLLLGDKLTAKADLTTLKQPLDKESLPLIDKRYGNWLYLKGLEQTEQQLIFHYLVVNVPTKNTEVKTPKFEVKLKDQQWVTIASTYISIGPSIAIEPGMPPLTPKSDVTPPLVDTQSQQQQLKIITAVFLIALLVLAIWHFAWKTKHRQPFDQAVHDLSRLQFHTVTADESARVLHNAFNQTAGTVMVYKQLDALFEQHVWLLPLKDRIEQFYQESEQHFFARDTQKGPDIDSVRTLAKACRSKEKLA